MRKLRIALILTFSSACFIAHRATDSEGVLRLTIVDAGSNRITPARITLRNRAGAYLVPDSALPVFADCGKIPLYNWVPAGATLQTRWGKYRNIRNPYRGSTDFYLADALATRLPTGHYNIRVEKGPEYNAEEQDIVIDAGKEQSVQVALRRWIDLPAEGWYSADDHLHIPRPSAAFDPVLSAWMQAEDIHVANLLQMGLARDVQLTPQRNFGLASVYQSAGTLLVGGQENPRTHVFGHSIILGGRHWIDLPQEYLLYDMVWHQAHREGALAGYAHLGVAGAQDGLAVWGQDRLIDFVEVLNLGFPFYQSWYDALNVGERVVPTAGTDYPCLADLPGRERFYAKIDGPLTFPSWMDAVRRGRTFVTNGPALDFTVNGSMMGDELALNAPGTVRVRARVRFDPDRDRVDHLEVVQAGQVVASVGPSQGPEIILDATIPISASTWLAARVSGDKVGEAPASSVEPFARYVLRLKRRADRNAREVLAKAARPKQRRISAGHTSPIYILVHGTPPVSEQSPAREVARARLALLDDLETRLDDAHIGDLAQFPGAGDGVPMKELRGNRAELVRAIQKAREQYLAIIQTKRR
jgi:hypothetical protein